MLTLSVLKIRTMDYGGKPSPTIDISERRPSQAVLNIVQKIHCSYKMFNVTTFVNIYNFMTTINSIMGC